MAKPRNVGIMVDSRDIELNLTRMIDTLRNANYKTLAANGVLPNEDGEYVDDDGDNLLMEEGVVKALLQDAIDSYLVATLPGKNKTDPSEFNYYLWDSFPNVAEYIQKEPQINSYVSSLFAATCGLLVNSLTPALNDLRDAGQNLEHIETFSQGPSTSYYILVGEDVNQELDINPDHHIEPLTKAERQERAKIELIKELGPDKYQDYIRKQEELKCNEAFTDWTNIVTSQPLPDTGVRKINMTQNNNLSVPAVVNFNDPITFVS